MSSDEQRNGASKKERNMLARNVLGLLSVIVVVFCRPVTAQNLFKVERSITKEPHYKTNSQRYCLLVFGPEAKYRVWLVLDGDTLYVDRNGNGDLTGPGKTVSRKRDTDTFEPITIHGPDGRIEGKLELVVYGCLDHQASKEMPEARPAVFINWKGRSFGCRGDEAGFCVWAAKPVDAPVLHIDGPFQMGFEVPAENAFVRKSDGHYELAVGVGTKGLGKGSFVHLSYDHGAIPTNVYPKAILEFPNKSPGGPPIRVEQALKQRC
jgi:hypothetical protein